MPAFPNINSSANGGNLQKKKSQSMNLNKQLQTKLLQGGQTSAQPQSPVFP